MAQVIKYQNGGTTPKKYGTFTIDDNTIEVDDDFLDQLTKYGRSLRADVGNQFQKIVDAVRSGENISVSTLGDGSVTGKIDFNLSRNQRRRGEHARSGVGRFFGSMWHGKEQDAREAISALKNFKYNPKSPEKVNRDWSKDLTLEYERDSDGKFKLDNNRNKILINGANTIAALKRLENLSEILNYGDNDEFRGYNGLTKQQYIDLYNTLGPNGVKSLLNDLKSGAWTDAQKEALNDIGILIEDNPTDEEIARRRESEETPEEKARRERAAAVKRYTDIGLNEAAMPFINIGDNGELFITDAFNTAFGNQNAIFNDWWESHMNQSGNWNPDYNFLKGYTRIGNKLYRTDTMDQEGSTLYNFVHSNDGFYDLNKQSRFEDANKILQYLWGRKDESEQYSPQNYYNEWFAQQDPSFRYRSLNGLYQTPGNNQLIEYWSNINGLDMMGRPSTYKYALLDNNGNHIRDISAEQLSSYEQIPEGQQLAVNLLKRINDNNNSVYNGRIIKRITDDQGNNTGYTLYINPDDPDDIILSSSAWDYASPIKGKNIKIPREFGSFINRSGNQFWSRLLSDKTYQNRFFRTLLEGVGTQMGEGLRNIFGSSTLTTDDLKYLLNSTDDLNISNLRHYLENVYGDRNGRTLSERRANYLVNPYIENNQIPINQKGGVIGTTVKSSSKDAEQKVTKHTDPIKTAGTKDDWNLSTEDRYKLASIGLDVASLIAAIPTGGNPVAATTGLGASFADFGANVSKDGFQIKDLGSLGLNVGLDLISLLPGIGIAGKAAKVVRTIKKSINTIRRPLLAIGAINAANSATRIANGEGTLDDWKSLSMGLMSIKGIKNEVQNIRATQYKGKNQKSVGKTVEDLRNEYVDKVVSEKNLTKFNGNTVEWANSDGTIKDYDKAIKDLTDSGHLKISKAQELKWKGIAAASNKKAKLDNLVSSNKNPFSSNFILSMKNRTLPDNFDITSFSGNTSKLRTYGRLATTNPELFENVQNNGWLLPTLTFGSDYGGSWYYRSPIFKRPIFVPKVKTNQLLLQPSTGIRDIPVTISERKNPTEIINIDPYLQSIDGNIGFKFYRKGGKIIKAQKGSNTMYRTFTDQNDANNDTFRDLNDDLNIANGKGTVVVEGQRSNDMRSGLSERMARDQRLLSQDDKIKMYNEKDLPGIKKMNDDILNSWKKPEKDQKMFGNANWKNALGNIGSNLVKMADFLDASNTINKSNQKQKDAVIKGMVGSQKSTPAEFYSTFSDNGLHRRYNDRISAMRNYQSSTSDPKLLMAERLMRDSNIDQLKGERDSQFSQMIGQHNDKLLAQKQQYANARTQIADTNKQNWQTGLANLDMLESNRIQQQRANRSYLMYEEKQNQAKDLLERQKVEDNIAKMKADKAFSDAISTAYQTNFNKLSAEDKEKYGDVLGYAHSTDLKGYNDLYNKHYLNYGIDRYNAHQSHSTFGRRSIPYVKRGGTLYLDVGERSFLNQQRDFNKAINNLNNSIIKLFLKMMS